ncbi:hypothetical protein STRAU_4768 [Streptomyces aurantiacus JA 4570]|uniref:Uncharacterized protein n=1 Tax=Streptomyces aurantiacus JA 4570 TaxID=1286094 RepID=S3ZGB6_9ACTN|nr:hypothetical protein STRAU_4768 [Streptomyces aurantiacus JA 4570]
MELTAGHAPSVGRGSGVGTPAFRARHPGTPYPFAGAAPPLFPYAAFPAVRRTKSEK